MSSPTSSIARPEWHEPLVAPPAEGDDVGWLVTFSDLVLQLFAFIVVVAVCGAAARQPGPSTAPASGAPSALAVAAPPHDADARASVAEDSEARFIRTEDVTRSVGSDAPEHVARALGDETESAARAGSAEPALAAFAPATVWADDSTPPAHPAVRLVEPVRRAAVAPVAAVETTSLGVESGAVPRESALAAAARDEKPEAESADDPNVAAARGRVVALGRYLSAFVAASGDPTDATVTTGDVDVRLAFGGRLGFRPGSTELLPAGRKVLHEVRRLASAVPELAIEVAGYTDDVPIHSREFPSNLELSLARAARVTRELQRDDPGLAVRTVALGFGEQHALAPNDGPANRARNRRVEVRLVTLDQSMP